MRASAINPLRHFGGTVPHGSGLAAYKTMKTRRPGFGRVHHCRSGSSLIVVFSLHRQIKNQMLD